MSAFVEIVRGAAPLIVSMPHTGTDIPPEIAAQLVSPWRSLKDTDWHVDQLYAFAAELGATLVRTRISRTVIDVNRDPSGRSLYPGQATTGLCPLTTFDGEPLYRAGEEPDDADIAARRTRFFDPYHAGLAAEIARLRAEHPAIVLFEAHSIRSRVPLLFEGELPGLNIGTDGGATCAAALEAAITDEAAQSGISHVVNGRFRGGWTTRHYGRFAEGVHAIQLELADRTYLDEPDSVSPETWPPAFDPARAAPLQAVLRRMLGRCIDFAKEQA